MRNLRSRRKENSGKPGEEGKKLLEGIEVIPNKTVPLSIDDEFTYWFDAVR
jgi:hypothetical protein